MGIKLVIWDLDDTFWKGTLSEGEVYAKPENLNLVKTFVDRGIMNSIVSKNCYKEAMEVLKEWNIDQYFIFPKISWGSKGEAVKNLLLECNLRAENTLFIDDNISNLEEVKYYNPGITCELPTFLYENDLLSKDEFKGKNDISHSRLAQYRTMELRADTKSSYTSNEEFLRASNICITFNNDCLDKMDRLSELVQRTNQLNYTKNRMSMEELAALLSEDGVRAEYISMKDNYGDYGIVGFYLLKNNRLIHFLFSCRALGVGIETYVYNRLKCPQIHVVGEVAVNLDPTNIIDWITEYQAEKTQKSIMSSENMEVSKAKLLMIGGCDLEQACDYLECSFDIRKEFPVVVDGIQIKTSDTVQLLGAKNLAEEEKAELCENLPFLNKEISFQTQLFSGKYQTIILSVVDDYVRGMYRHNEKKYFIGYGNWFAQQTYLNRLRRYDLSYFNHNFTYMGKESLEMFEANLREIIEAIGSNVRLIIINGNELDVADWIGEERCARNIEMNKIVDKLVSRYENVSLLDMRKIVTSREMLPQKENRHYDRLTYFNMAKEITNMCNTSDTECLRMKEWLEENY